MKYSYLFIFMMAIIVSACTRPTANKSSSMTIALPKEMKLKAVNSAQATTGFLGHVVINVRGPGIDVPISVNYDADKHNNVTPTSLPGSFTLDVPAGSGRLIQIMAVYIDLNTKIGDFYYGDVSQELVSGDNNVAIPVSLVGSGNVDGGRVAGRYYLADGSTPTGVLETRFQPPAGKPAIVIERHSILNGWFSTFALESVPMDLVLVPNEVKMFTALKLNNFDSTTLTDNKKMKVILPDRYQTWGSGMGGENRRGETSVIGFFGDGVPAGSKVCFTEAARTYTQIFTDATKTTAVLWSASSTKVADVRAIKSSGVVACTGNDLTAAYTSVLPFTPSLLDNSGSSEAVPGFMGIFRFPTSMMNGSSPVRVNYGLGSYTAQFSVLPDSPSVVDSVGVFYRSYNSPRDYYGNGGDVPCQQLSQGGLGFLKISSIPLVPGTLDYNVTNTAPADISNSAVMAFCPMKNGVAIGGGYAVNYMSSNPYSLPMVANSFNAFTEFPTVGIGQCHKIRLSLVNESAGTTNYNVTNSSVVSFTLSSTAANISFHSDENTCIAGTSNVSSVSIPANSVYGEIWYKDSSIETGKAVSIVSSLSTGVSRSLPVSFQSVSAATKFIVHENNLKMGPNECRMVDVYLEDVNSIPAAGVATTINIGKLDLPTMSSSTDTTFGFYSDCLSGTAITSLSYTANDFKKSFSIKTGVSPSSDKVVRLSGGLGSADMFFNITPQADHLSLFINNGNPVYKGSCVPVYVEAQDPLNAKISNATFDFNMNIYHPTIPGGYGSFKSNCSNSMGSSGPYTLATGSYSLNFSASAAQNGLQMEAQSPFQGRMNPFGFNILPAPPVDRASTLKVHLMSDDLVPSSSPNLPDPLSSSSWPILDTFILPTSGLSIVTSVNKNTNPRRDGALFTVTSALMSGSLPSIVSTNEVVMTIKFKIESVLGAGTRADILSLDTGNGSVGIYVDDLSSGVFKIKGSGGWVGPDLIVGNWYTVTLAKDASGNTSGFVNGLSVGSVGSGANPVGTLFTGFRIGSGFQGAVKAVIIDAGSTNVIAGVNISSEYVYISSRVSDL